MKIKPEGIDWIMDQVKESWASKTDFKLPEGLGEDAVSLFFISHIGGVPIERILNGRLKDGDAKKMEYAKNLFFESGLKIVNHSD